MAQETVDNALPVMEKIGLHPDASLDRLRKALVAILKALQERDIGAGRTMNERQAVFSKAS